jgi:hypothetical protein
MTEQITVRDRSTGEEYRGRSPESIARRVWGRDTTVHYSSDPECPWQAEVVYTDRYGTHIAAVLHVDADARAAAEGEPADPAGHDDLLAEVRAASTALAEAETRRAAAVRAAFDAGRDRAAIAAAAGKTRDWVYKTLR